VDFCSWLANGAGYSITLQKRIFTVTARLLSGSVCADNFTLCGSDYRRRRVKLLSQTN
jgi:hypothetical protein